MKRIAIIFIVLTLMIAAVTPQAEAQLQFLIGVAAGAAIFGGSDTVAGGGAMIIYAAPRVSERVNVLSIKFSSVYVKPWLDSTIGDQKGITIYSMFTSLEKNPNEYEILQVVRVFDGSAPANAAFWFAYASKKDVIPVEKLPPLQK